MATAQARHRTFAVVVLAIIAGIAGVWAVIDTLRYLRILPISQLGDLTFFSPSINWLGALLAGIVALIWFSVMLQLWNLNPQGWLFVVIIAIIDLVLLLLSALGGSTWNAVMPGVVISGLALILALLPSTKAAFAIPPRR